MTRHNYTPLLQPAHEVHRHAAPATPCGRPRTWAWAFAGVFAVLFLVAFWPGAPLSHGPGLNALIGGGANAGATQRAAAAAVQQLQPRKAGPGARPPTQQQPAQQQQAPQQQQQQQPAAKAAAAPAAAGSGDSEKVQLELFVMSKCPDAKFCEHAFNRILAKIHPIVHVQTE